MKSSMTKVVPSSKNVKMRDSMCAILNMQI